MIRDLFESLPANPGIEELEVFIAHFEKIQQVLVSHREASKDGTYLGELDILLRIRTRADIARAIYKGRQMETQLPSKVGTWLGVVVMASGILMQLVGGAHVVTRYTGAFLVFAGFGLLYPRARRVVLDFLNDKIRKE